MVGVRQEFPYTEGVQNAYEETVRLLGDLRTNCHVVLSIAARGANDAGVQVGFVHGYFIPSDDIRLCARLHMPIPRAEYVGNSHWWLRFPNEGYSLDIVHSQVDPENPLLMVPTFLEEAHGIFYRSGAEPLLVRGRGTKKLLNIWRTAFL